MTSYQPYNYDLREFQLRSVCLLDAIDKVCKEHEVYREHKALMVIEVRKVI